MILSWFLFSRCWLKFILIMAHYVASEMFHFEKTRKENPRPIVLAQKWHLPYKHSCFVIETFVPISFLLFCLFSLSTSEFLFHIISILVLYLNIKWIKMSFLSYSHAKKSQNTFKVKNYLKGVVQYSVLMYSAHYRQSGEQYNRAKMVAKL